jgi:hypothetical protein
VVSSPMARTVLRTGCACYRTYLASDHQLLPSMKWMSAVWRDRCPCQTPGSTWQCMFGVSPFTVCCHVALWCYAVCSSAPAMPGASAESCTPPVQPGGSCSLTCLSGYGPQEELKAACNRGDGTWTLTGACLLLREFCFKHEHSVCVLTEASAHARRLHIGAYSMHLGILACTLA